MTRFAPSPTGYLHLGHVAHAWWVWETARGQGGSVVLRIEDHDRVRCRPEYERQLLNDLRWLGFTPDAGFPLEGTEAPSPWRQSDCDDDYHSVLDELAARGLVYACACSRSDIARAVGRQPEPNEEVPYPGTCRDLGLTPGRGRSLRVRLPGDEVRFTDLRLGAMVQRPAAQCGDLVVRDRLGQWTYQFAVVVDDMRHGIDLVVRGKDLLSSTGRQILLARLLGREAPPAFLHHPLVLNAQGVKLSKRDRAEGLGVLREAGLMAEEIVRRATECR